MLLSPADLRHARLVSAAVSLANRVVSCCTALKWHRKWHDCHHTADGLRLPPRHPCSWRCSCRLNYLESRRVDDPEAARTERPLAVPLVERPKRREGRGLEARPEGRRGEREEGRRVGRRLVSINADALGVSEDVAKEARKVAQLS